MQTTPTDVTCTMRLNSATPPADDGPWPDSHPPYATDVPAHATTSTFDLCRPSGTLPRYQKPWGPARSPICTHAQQLLTTTGRSELHASTSLTSNGLPTTTTTTLTVPNFTPLPPSRASRQQMFKLMWGLFSTVCVCHCTPVTKGFRGSRPSF